MYNFSCIFCLRSFLRNSTNFCLCLNGQTCYKATHTHRVVRKCRLFVGPITLSFNIGSDKEEWVNGYRDMEVAIISLFYRYLLPCLHLPKFYPSSKFSLWSIFFHEAFSTTSVVEPYCLYPSLDFEL